MDTIYFTTRSENFECCLLLQVCAIGYLVGINIFFKHFLYLLHIVYDNLCVHMRVECFAFNQNYAERYFFNKIKIGLKSFYFYENHIFRSRNWKKDTTFQYFLKRQMNTI